MYRKNRNSCTVSAGSIHKRCPYLIGIPLLVFFTWVGGISPALGFTVAIDVGHSPSKPGAISARGVGEYRFNRALADLLLLELKENRTLRPILMNGQGEDISLAERVAAIKALKPDLVLSIHHDSVQKRYLLDWQHNGRKYSYSDRYHGYSLFISESNRYADRSLFFAGLLGSALGKAGLQPSLHHAEKIRGEGRRIIDKDKGIYLFDELIVLGKVECPAVLLECGIIKNREEEVLLSTPSYRSKIVSALSKAISSFEASCRPALGMP